jgi:type IV pilus assembly protein PilV
MKQPSGMQRGVTMIEVLVALLVLSIGLLGVAATVAKSSRFTAGAWAQSAVANSLSDMAERIRSSPNAASADFNLTDDYATQRSDIEAGNVVIAKDCDTNVCTPAESAAFHIATLRLDADRSLPGAAAWVQPVSSAASGASATSFEVAVMWFDKSNVDGAGAANAALVCGGGETGIDQRRCCPAAASPAAGVRCTRTVLVP